MLLTNLHVLNHIMWPVHALIPCMHVVEEYTWNLHTAHQEGMVKTVKVGNDFIANSTSHTISRIQISWVQMLPMLHNWELISRSTIVADSRGLEGEVGSRWPLKEKHLATPSLFLYNCKFFNNEAFWGEGLKASFQDESQNNTLIVLKSTFQHNRCLANGVGGTNVGYTFYHQSFPCYNMWYRILFSDCKFSGTRQSLVVVWHSILVTVPPVGWITKQSSTIVVGLAIKLVMDQQCCYQFKHVQQF